MPLNRNRFYMQETAAWRQTDPFSTLGAATRLALALYTVVGYAVQRWFRVEGYYAVHHQDNRAAGGCSQPARSPASSSSSLQPVRIQ